MLDRIRIVMVNTSHAGNIGAAARAMKTMGLVQLWLVDPVEFSPADAHGRDFAMASGAVDLMAQARVVATLDEALAGCVLVLGASARVRTVPWPHLTSWKGAATALEQLRAPGVTGDVAIVFGRENSGLTNEELARCHFHVEIPGNPEYPVLNVAAAVQVLAYELRRQWLTAGAVLPADGAQPEMLVERVRWDKPPASADELEKFFGHLEKTLLDLQFFVVDDPRQLLVRLRRLFLRARPDEVELRILRGILGAAQKAAHNAAKSAAQSTRAGKDGES